jgi:hypothetical protein
VANRNERQEYPYPLQNHNLDGFYFGCVTIVSFIAEINVPDEFKPCKTFTASEEALKDLDHLAFDGLSNPFAIFHSAIS